MDIAKRITQIIEDKGLAAKEFMSAVDMKVAIYRRVEIGTTEPSWSTLEKIAKALGLKLSDFFDAYNDFEGVNSHDASLMEKVKPLKL